MRLNDLLADCEPDAGSRDLSTVEPLKNSEDLFRVAIFKTKPVVS